MSDSNPLLLHIETATAVCSVAISKGDDLLELEETSTGLRHSSSLIPFIRDVVVRAGIMMKDLDGVSVSSGPGSFTGLRVGMASAKGICFGLDIPIIALSTLEALAIAASQKWSGFDYYLPMIDARRMEVYAAIYDASGNCLVRDEAKVIDASIYHELSRDGSHILYFGDGAGKCQDVLPKESFTFADLLCSASHLVIPAVRSWREERFSNPMYAAPVYLKPPNITKPSKPSL